MSTFYHCFRHFRRVGYSFALAVAHAIRVCREGF